MGIQDKLLQLETDSAQARTDGEYSEAEINWGVANPDQGRAGLKLRVVVKELFEAAGAATLTIKLVHGAATAPTTLLMTFDTIAKASLVVGYEREFPWPFEHLQYTRLLYTVATGPFTGGKLDAHILPA